MLKQGQLQARQRRLNDNGNWEDLEITNIPLASSSAAASFSIEVAPHANGTRRIKLSVQGASEEVTAAFAVSSSRTLKEDAFYLAFIHSKFNATFVTTGDWKHTCGSHIVFLHSDIYWLRLNMFFTNAQVIYQSHMSVWK